MAALTEKAGGLGPGEWPGAEAYGLLAAGEDAAPWAFGIDAEGRCTERHLQCVWYSDALRPPLVSDSGEEIAVESPGRWNLESGPDFIDAVLRVGAGRRRVVGDVELHVRPSGWTAHRHAGDPRYAGVVLHLTYHGGTRPRDLPPGVLCATMRDALLARPGFSFDAIDTAAFPHAEIPATPRPCRIALGGDPAAALAAIRAAGAYRLDLKRRRMQAAIAATGEPSQVLYSAVMAALGYKRNSPAFRRLAALYPVGSWSGDRKVDFARLLGLAGLLPENPPGEESLAPLARSLWDAWWRNSLDAPDPPVAWAGDAVRPQNSPFRRLAAAAALFSRGDALFEAVRDADCADPATPRRLGKLVAELSGFPEIEPVMSWRRPAAKPAALVGAATASAIVTNAIVPFMAAFHPRQTREIYSALPPETTSQPIRLMASRIFGPDHNPRTTYANSGLAQQGLIQIHNDFCLSCKSDCAGCAFARRRHRDGGGRCQQPMATDGNR